MTNIVTNLVFVVGQAAPLTVAPLGWDAQVFYFFSGAAAGFPLAMGLAVVWGIVRAVTRPPKFPTE